MNDEHIDLSHFDSIKSNLVQHRAQAIFFDQGGEILSSCNSIFRANLGNSVYKEIPYLGEIQLEIEAGILQGRELVYPPIQTVIGGKEGYYGFMISISEHSIDEIGVLILDLTPSSSTSRKRRTPQQIKVLIVEDQQINQMVFQQVLKQRGYQYGFAYDGFEAIEKLKNEAYDVILLDLQMPKMDGAETLAFIRKNLEEKGKRFKVIATTGLTDLDKLDQDANYRFDAVISKPPDATLMHETILMLMNLIEPKKPSRSNLINLTYLKEVCGDNVQLMKELIDIFLESVPGELKEMNALSSQQDWRGLKEKAHRIKANFKYVGVIQLFQLTDELERNAATVTKTDEIPSLIARLSTLVTQVMDELQIQREKLI